MDLRCNKLIIVLLGRRIFKAPKEKWVSPLKELKNTDSLCKTYRETIDTESRFRKENASILAWITKTDQRQDHKLLREKLGLDDTYQHCGQWLFETARYADWKDFRDASKCVLWLKGPGRHCFPGCDKLPKQANLCNSWYGKDNIDVRDDLSMVNLILILYHSCKAIDMLHDDQQLEPPGGEHRIIHYYCTGSKPGETRSNCNLCLRALIRQLARDSKTSSVAACVQAEYDKRKMDDSSDSRFSAKECEDILRRLIPRDPAKMRTTIIIDALDECDDHGYELLRSLASILQTRPRSVCLFLSSQMHVEVEPYFKDQGIILIEVNPSNTKTDMQYFIKKEIDKQREDPRPGILKSDEMLCQKVEAALSDHARGM